MTVGELITELSKYPAEMEVLISDADTDWALPVHIGPNAHWEVPQIGMRPACYLYGTYREAIK